MAEHKACTRQQSLSATTAASAPPQIATQPVLTDREFNQFRELLLKLSGIQLSTSKKTLVISRLGRRLRHLGLTSFQAYFELATRPDNKAEKQQMLDLLTTNETYFFREDKHFDFLREQLLHSHPKGSPFQVWSAASSSGEEAYSIAMVLADSLSLNADWSICGTDINLEVLQRGQQAKYPIEAQNDIPEHYLKRYCLKGIEEEAGNLLINRSLRARVKFQQFNLNSDSWGRLPQFDVIFLRNVMIYFNNETKQQLINKMARQIKPGGYLIIGLSETLQDCDKHFQRIIPSVYRLQH